MGCESYLEKEEWNWRNQPTRLQALLQSHSYQDTIKGSICELHYFIITDHIPDSEKVKEVEKNIEPGTMDLGSRLNSTLSTSLKLFISKSEIFFFFFF